MWILSYPTISHLIAPDLHLRGKASATRNTKLEINPEIIEDEPSEE
jgi:hypothetical protein